MKGFYFIPITLLFVNCSIDSSKKDQSFSTATKDSVNIYLDFANNDTLEPSIRLRFNTRAYNILKNENNDSINRINLFKVANRYYNIAAFNEYKNTSSFLLNRTLQSNDTASIAKAYSYLGDYYFRTSSKDSAFFYYLKADKIYRGLDDKINLATINLNKATVLWHESDFFGSESATLEALKYLDYNNDTRKIYEAFTLLGLISNELTSYKKALEYHNKALEVVHKSLTNDPERPLAITLNNIGNVYQNMGDNDKAIKHFNAAISDKILHQYNPRVYAIILDNLAYSKFKVNNEDSEIPKLFITAMEIHEQNNNKSLSIFTKVRFSEYYFARNDTLSAIQLAEEALEAANLGGTSADKLGPLKLLSSIVPEKASIYSKEYIKISDSLQRAERKSKDKFARIQYETEEIISKNDKLEEQNRNLLLFFVGTVMIGLLLFVIRTQRAKNRELLHKQAQQKANEDIYNLMLSQQNKIEEGRIQEKRRIAQELHDGVLGRLFGARLNLDSLNKMDGEDAEEKRNNYLAELKNIEQDIREISHDLNREKFVLINNFVAILNNLLEEQAASFDTTVHANIDNTIKWDRISNSLKINLYRIVQEALQNINKYAKASIIEVSLTQKDGHINLSISDNGIGFAVEKKSRGIGLQNMVSRANECEGVFDIRSKKGKGTTISIEFPIESKSITA